MNIAELAQHYRAVRMRLMGPPVVNRVVINHQPAIVVNGDEKKKPIPIWVKPLPERTDFATKMEAVRYQVAKMIRDEHMGWDEVFSLSRMHKYVMMRRKIWYWLRQCGLSTTQIKRLSMPKNPSLRQQVYDHTTIVHAVKMFERNPVDLPPPIICGTIRVHHSKKKMETHAPRQGA